MPQVPMGVYFGDPNNGTFAAQYDSFISLSGGRKPVIFTVFCDQDHPADPALDGGGYGWPQQVNYVLSGIAGQSRLAGVTPSVAVPFALRGSGTNYYASITSGAYDGLINGMVDAAKNNGFTKIYFRPAWEYQFQAWAPTAGTVSNFVAAMQRFATTARARGVAIGVVVKIIWNPNVLTSISGVNPFSLTYPGDAYVDVLAVDSYGNGVDDGWNSHNPNTANSDPTQYWFQNMLSQALSSGKPICLPESGSSDAGFPTAMIGALNARNSAIQVEFVSMWVDEGAAPGNNWAAPGAVNQATANAWMAGFGVNGTVVNTVSGGPGAPVITTGTTTTTSVALNWAAVTGNAPITYQVAIRLTNPPLVNTVGPTITDAQNNVWGISSGAKVVFNGTAVAFTSAVTAIEYVANVMWQFGSGAWYSMGVSAGAVTDTSGGVGTTTDPKLTFVNTGGTTSALTATVSALQPNTSYDFQLTAANSSGSAASNVLTASTVAGVVLPSAPTLTTGTITTTSIVLNWSSSTGSTPITYQPLFRIAPAAFATFGSAIAGFTATITGLTAATSYDLEVRATNSGGSTISAILTVSTATAGSQVAPNAPGNLAATAPTTTTMNLGWSASTVGSPAPTYQPLFKLAAAGTYTAFGSASSATSVVITGLVANSSYNFEVTATNANGSATTAPVTNSTIAAGGQTSLMVSWVGSTTGSPPITYQTNFRVVGASTFIAFGSPIAGTSVVVTGLSHTTNYEFDVVAINTAGTATSAIATGTTT